MESLGQLGWRKAALYTPPQILGRRAVHRNLKSRNLVATLVFLKVWLDREVGGNYLVFFWTRGTITQPLHAAMEGLVLEKFLANLVLLISIFLAATQEYLLLLEFRFSS